MNTITLRVANTEPFIGTSGIAIIGKNGFETTIGQVNPLVTNMVINLVSFRWGLMIRSFSLQSNSNEQCELEWFLLEI